LTAKNYRSDYKVKFTGFFDKNFPSKKSTRDYVEMQYTLADIGFQPTKNIGLHINKDYRDRCYGLKNIFAEIFVEKFGVFVQNTAGLCNIWIINCFFRKTSFSRRKLAKIAENCDHYIDPKSGKIN
jgi:hypothetical protein